MRIDGVDLHSFYPVRPKDNGRIQAEDREELRNSPANQEPLIRLNDILASTITLDQLFDAGLQPGSSIENVKIISPVPETNEDDDVHALPEEVLRQGRIYDFAARIALYERDRRNTAMKIAVESGRYKATADEKIDDLLKNINTLLAGAKLTSKQSEALELFNAKIQLVKNSFQPFFFDKKLNVHGFGTDGLFAGLESAFETLAESFGPVERFTPELKYELEAVFKIQLDQLRTGLQDTLGVSDLTEEDIVRILAQYIKSYGGTEEQAMKDQQLVYDSMPEIIEAIKKFMPDFRIAEPSIHKPGES